MDTKSRYCAHCKMICKHFVFQALWDTSRCHLLKNQNKKVCEFIWFSPLVGACSAGTKQGFSSFPHSKRQLDHEIYETKLFPPIRYIHVWRASLSKTNFVIVITSVWCCTSTSETTELPIEIVLVLLCEFYLPVYLCVFQVFFFVFKF